MKHIELKGQLREAVGKKAIKALRREGLVPCNIYGLGMENIHFAVNDTKPVVIDVPVVVVGHAEGVKAGGKLLVSARKLKISAMLHELPDTLEVDCTPLQIGKQIVAGDLHYEGVTIVSPKATIICSVRPTRASAQAAQAQ